MIALSRGARSARPAPRHPITSVHPRRFFKVLTIAATIAGLATAAARAGTYDVTACHLAAGNVNNAFVAVNGNAPSVPADAVHVETVDSCASSALDTGGLRADDVLQVVSGTPTGRIARWRLAAPAGLSITHVQAWSYIKDQTDEFWTPFLHTFEGSVLQTCEITPGGGFCDDGLHQYSSGVSPNIDAVVNATGLELGISCDPTSGSFCGGGFSLHRALATLFAARVTITETTGPTLSNLSGALVAPGGALSGMQTATFDAADASGISATRVYVDGTPVSSARACDYTFARPCTDAPAVTVSVNTATLANGPHTIRLAAVNAAGVETRSAAVTINVYNPPAGGGGGSPPPPALPPPPPAPAAAPPPELIAIPAPTVIELADAHLRARTTTRSGKTISVSGTITRQAAGIVTTSFSQSIHGHLVRKRVAARIHAGRWSARLQLTGSLARVSRGLLRARFAGSPGVSSDSAAMTPSTPS